MSWKKFYDRKPDRRSFLKGVALSGAGMFLAPLLGQMQAEASGLPARKRVVFVVEGNGFYGWPTGWTRLNQRDPIITPLDNLAEQAPFCAALEPWKDRIACLNGLDNKQGAGLHAGHYAIWYALSCMPYLSGSSLPGGITIDQAIANHIGATDVFSSVRLGVASSTALKPTCSAAGPGSPLPHQHDPVAAYKEIFGAASSDPELRAAFVERGKLLDYLTEDINRVMPKLAAEERWKFERYLYSVETFQQRQAALDAVKDSLDACLPATPGAWPVSPADMAATDRLAVQFDLATQAMICGLTHVAVIGVGNGPNAQKIDFSPWGFGGRHTMGHGSGETPNRPGGSAGLAEVTNEVNKHVANMIQALEAMPEGEGNMFDNTTIVYINDNGSEHHAKYDNFPVMLCGELGGALNLGGRMIEYPNREQPTTRGLPQLWNTLLYGVGVPTDDFAAEGRAKSDGPLDELMP
jgi:hypothetical protein